MAATGEMFTPPETTVPQNVHIPFAGNVHMKNTENGGVSFPLKELRVRGDAEGLRRALAVEHDRYLRGLSGIREEMDALRQAFGKRAWGRGEMRVALTPHDSNTTATNPYRISQLRWCWYRAGDSYKASGRIFVAPSFCELLAQTGARATHQDFLAQFLAQIWETQADLYREVMATEVQRCLLNQRMRQCRAMLISLDQLLEVERLTRETAHGQRSLLEAFPQAFR
ncbi:hypothetical protein [Cardiobacterium hominis]|jgi:hypothetical protein|uniref:hypothetical protein n=1 Tax=Cardiobacterium hominis TaxID=2718 RepID=UPI0028E3914F|nr:hypothetical protein [Cardiobacterium hominis]